MTSNENISSQISEVAEALAQGDSNAALELLVELREQGVTTAALEEVIESLRAGNTEETQAWVSRVVARLEAGHEAPLSEAFDGSQGEFTEVPSTVGLSSIEEDLLDSVDGGLQDMMGSESDPPSIDFALVSESEVEADQGSDAAESVPRGHLSDEQKTRLKGALSEYRKQSGGFSGKEATRRASALELESSAAAMSEMTPSMDPDDIQGDSSESDVDAIESGGESSVPGESSPRVVSNQGAVDDFFADILDDEPDEATSTFDAVDSKTGKVSNLMPEVDDGAFDDPFEDLDEESNVRDLTPMGGMDAVSREEMAEASEPEGAGESGIDPANPFADLMHLEDSEPEPVRPSYESGKSQVRYAGVEPPPPTHRLKGGADVGQVDSDSFSFDSDDDDFDLGFADPGASPGAKPFGDVEVEKPESEVDEFDFDLGLSAPRAEKPPGDAVDTKPGDAAGTKPGNEQVALARDASQTRPNEGLGPVERAEGHDFGFALEQESEPIDEDEFFALAESFASESSAAESTGTGKEPQPYRGEPVIRNSGQEDDNPFAHEAPTGVRHAAIESSFVLEEIREGRKPKNPAAESQVATNMSAILLEANRMYESGDLESALDICAKVLSRGDNPDAQELMAKVEGELERQSMSEIGSLSRTPKLAVAMSDIATLDLDHREGFLLSQIDGTMAFEDIVELSGMPRRETLGLLAELLAKNVISVD